MNKAILIYNVNSFKRFVYRLWLQDKQVKLNKKKRQSPITNEYQQDKWEMIKKQP